MSKYKTFDQKEKVEMHKEMIKSEELCKYEVSLFDMVQKEVLKLLNDGPYNRFLKVYLCNK